MSPGSFRCVVVSLFCACGLWAAEPSRAKRVPGPKEALDGPLPAEARKRIEAVDAAIQDPKSDLRQLHAAAVKRFIESGGFGFERMPIVFTKQEWKTDDLER